MSESDLIRSKRPLRHRRRKEGIVLIFIGSLFLSTIFFFSYILYSISMIRGISFLDKAFGKGAKGAERRSISSAA